MRCGSVHIRFHPSAYRSAPDGQSHPRRTRRAPPCPSPPPKKNLQYITAHAECTAVEIHIIPVILNINQLPDHIVPVLFPFRAERNNHLHVVLRASDSIDTRNMETTMTSRSAHSVQKSRKATSLSISSFRAESFAIYVSEDGT